MDDRWPGHDLYVILVWHPDDLLRLLCGLNRSLSLEPGRSGREIAFTLGMISFALGVLFLLLFETIRVIPILYLFAACFGSGWGVSAPLFMSVAADLYKGKNFGWVYGALEGVLGIGAALGPYVGGVIFDRTGSYFWGFMLVILFSLLSIPLVWLVAPRKFRRIRRLSQ